MRSNLRKLIECAPATLDERGLHLSLQQVEILIYACRLSSAAFTVLRLLRSRLKASEPPDGHRVEVNKRMSQPRCRGKQLSTDFLLAESLDHVRVARFRPKAGAKRLTAAEFCKECRQL